jgi:hypothetical protein
VQFTVDVAFANLFCRLGQEERGTSGPYRAAGVRGMASGGRPSVQMLAIMLVVGRLSMAVSIRGSTRSIHGGGK